MNQTSAMPDIRSMVASSTGVMRSGLLTQRLKFGGGIGGYKSFGGADTRPFWPKPRSQFGLESMLSRDDRRHQGCVSGRRRDGRRACQQLPGIPLR